jgi:hypothetical protein
MYALLKNFLKCNLDFSFINKKAPVRRLFDPEVFHLACEAILVFTFISTFTQP